MPKKTNTATPDRRASNGGSRAGSGAKPKDDTKNTVTIRVYDWQRKEIIAKYGSLQKGVDSLCAPTPPWKLE